MKYSVKINRFKAQNDNCNGLYYISVINNNMHSSYTNNNIDQILQEEITDELLSFENLCEDSINKDNEIWFKNWKSADKTRYLLNQLLN